MVSFNRLKTSVLIWIRNQAFLTKNTPRPFKCNRFAVFKLIAIYWKTHAIHINILCGKVQCTNVTHGNQKLKNCNSLKLQCFTNFITKETAWSQIKTSNVTPLRNKPSSVYCIIRITVKEKNLFKQWMCNLFLTYEQRSPSSVSSKDLFGPLKFSSLFNK
jgi:hypothetical protein